MDVDPEEGLWFTDYPNPLLNRGNWNRGTLDVLLERSGSCGKLILPKTYVIDVIDSKM